MSAPKHGWLNLRLGLTIAAGGLLTASMTLGGCSVVYAEQSTPIRNPSAEQSLEPQPPSDVFYISVRSARIPQRTRDGRSWDKLGGSAPDVYAILFVDQVEVARTDVVPNSFEPTWKDNKPTNFKISPTTEVRVELWDENALVSHPICNQVIKDVADVSSVGSIELNCESGASMVVAVTEPKAKIGIGLYYEKRGNEAYISKVIAASSAGRAGIRPNEQILRVRGKAVSALTTGELESLMNANAQAGIALEVKGLDGEIRKVELRDEAMYPILGEGIEF
jgi:hypothetical protein